MTTTSPTFTVRKGKKVLIPDQQMLADALDALPPGRQSDLATVRNSLATAYGADMCCPVTVQRHLVEFSRNGNVPYWRVVDATRPFAKRLTGGAERVREMLVQESQ